MLDGTERQIIKDVDGNMPRPKIRACSISDPFVLIIREDDSIGLFIGETERGKIRRKDMSPMGDKVCMWLLDSKLLMFSYIHPDVSIPDRLLLCRHDRTFRSPVRVHSILSRGNYDPSSGGECIT